MLRQFYNTWLFDESAKLVTNLKCIATSFFPIIACCSVVACVLQCPTTRTIMGFFCDSISNGLSSFDIFLRQTEGIKLGQLFFRHTWASSKKLHVYMLSNYLLLWSAWWPKVYLKWSLVFQCSSTLMIKCFWIKTHGSVLCSPRKWGARKRSEYIDRNNKFVIFTHP